jgi:siroheme synthase (precorrin-2 oxidase/ferrochelatase)
MPDAHVLLIGHGSIGKFHVDRLTNLVQNVDVVEPLSSNRTQRNPQPDKCEIRFYGEISKLPENRVNEFAIITNLQDAKQTLELAKKIIGND